MPNATEIVYAGIDIAKNKLDAFVVAAGNKSFANDPKGLTALIQWLKSHGVSHIVIEPTGGFERELKQQAKTASLIVLQPNAAWVRHHAKASGKLAKTDKIDARLLHDYAMAHGEELRPQEPDSPIQAHLRALGRRREQLVHDLSKEKNRLQQTSDPDVLKDLKSHIKNLEKRIKALDGKSAKSAESDTQIKAKKEAMEKVKSAGPVLVSTLLAFMPELGTLNRNQAGMLAGLAPLNEQSGQRDAPRSIGGGRIEVRNCLYMACLSAIRWNDKIRPRYKRLRANGKAPKVALTACMRYLLIELNAVAREAIQRLEHPPMTSPCET